MRRSAEADDGPVGQAEDAGCAGSPPAAEAATVEAAAGAEAEAEAEAGAPKLSKNALKRLRRMQEWEDGKEDRKRRRREKRTATKTRRREERAALLAKGADPATLFAKKTPARLVPVALILDCDFDEYMTDKERVSMASQVTRCYSENRNGRYKSHLWISGWGGRMRERFETAMESQHAHWKGVGFEEGDFLAAAARAREAMRAPGGRGGDMVDSLRRSAEQQQQEQQRGTSWPRDERDPFPLPFPPPPLDETHRDVVYLTSESPYTLERLEPYTSYVIGGLVDKNREKGLCYRRAVQRGIRTAKLPIGQYMVMQSRQILATNHVVEIMVKWLHCEDWGQAFAQVIPKRKGGRLIEPPAETEETTTGRDPVARDDDDDDDDDDDADAAESETEEDDGDGGSCPTRGAGGHNH